MVRGGISFPPKTTQNGVPQRGVGSQGKTAIAFVCQYLLTKRRAGLGILFQTEEIVAG